MGSLGHRALLQYVDNNDLAGLRAILDSRHLSVDDRDEVSSKVFFYGSFYDLSNFELSFFLLSLSAQLLIKL